MTLFFLFHMACSSLLGLVFAAIFGGLGPVTAGFALALGAIASYFVSRADSDSKKLFIDPKNRSTETLWLERAALIFVMYISYRHFLYLFYEFGADYKSLNPNNFGDLPLHINYLRSLAQGAKFPWVNPSFSLDLLRYPMGIDLYNALWEAVGVRLQAHLFLVAMICSWMMVRFVRILASWWGIVGIYLSGGLSAWVMIDRSPLEAQSILAWKNIFLAVIVTQRGFLFALPAGIYLILRARRPEKLSWTFGFLWGVLAFFHLHTFAIISLILAGESLIRKDVKRFLPTLAIAVPIGSAFMFFSSHGLKSSSFVRWHWGWTNTSPNFFNYLAINFGPYLLLAVVALLYFIYKVWPKRETSPDEKRLALNYFLYFGLFFLFFNLMVAPWDWDNIKVLIWPYLLMLGVFSTFNSRMKTPGPQIALALILGYSGFMAIAPSLVSTDGALTIYNRGDLAKTKAAIHNIPQDAVFAAAMTHNHPLTFFGRLRAIGYEGHLWSHGIDAHEEVEKLKKIFDGDPAWRDLAHDLRVTHIYWGKDEINAFGVDRKPWQVRENNVSNVEDIAIYEVK